MDNNQDKITAFDSLFTTNSIQMLKVLIAYFEPLYQKEIAIYIKFLEFQYTVSFFKTYQGASAWKLPLVKNRDTESICQELMPYSDPSMKQKLQKFQQMYQNMNQMQEMLQMVQMMKELFPEGDNPFEGGSNDILAGLSGISGMDMSQLSELFQMFQSKENKES